VIVTLASVTHYGNSQSNNRVSQRYLAKVWDIFGRIYYPRFRANSAFAVLGWKAELIEEGFVKAAYKLTVLDSSIAG
jgi:hypothetical protein